MINDANLKLGLNRNVGGWCHWLFGHTEFWIRVSHVLFFQGASQATSHNSTALPDVHNVSEEQKHGVLCVKMHMFMIMAFILQRTA